MTRRARQAPAEERGGCGAANKMARTIWALLARGGKYDMIHVSARPA